jgi:UDP-N-acetylmuramate--alanine ligase
MVDLAKHVHFIGIGGVSMSGLAHILLHLNDTVSGSDRQESPETKRLREAGAEIFIGHSAENIKNPDLAVYTAAISKDNPELLRARALGIPTINRADFLGELMRDFEISIAVSGTHGKTTTTGMLACVFNAAKLNPTVMIGGNLPQIGGNIQIGGTDVLILEACEYVDSFLSFNPNIAVITNIEADHLDYFSSVAQIRDSFTRFIDRLHAEGCAVVNKDNKNAVVAAEKSDRKKLYYSLRDRSADLYANELQFNEGIPSFEVMSDGKMLADIALKVRGEHNVSNALAAFGAAMSFGVGCEDIAAGLGEFTGTERRFEYRGEVNGVRLFDDYAHHPSEIKTTFLTAETYPHNKIWYIFQPHTYSRTQSLHDEFVDVLSRPENMIIADIYAARENPIKNVNAKNLAKDCGADYVGSLSEIAAHLSKKAKNGDLIVTIGAGDVNKIISELLL